MSGKINSLYIYSATTAITLGGLILGYDIGVISAPLGFLKIRFELDATMAGFITSCAVIGSMLGVSFAGNLSDHLGRKKVLFFSALLVALGALGCAFSQNVTQLVIGRIICGLGAGAAAMLPSMYISEIAPANIRGRLISINQFSIVFGILAVYFVNAQIAGNHDEVWNQNIGWRWMFAANIFPPLILLVSLLFIPESPRWLIRQGKEQAALAILTRIGGQNYAQTELNEINQALGKKDSAVSLKQLLQPGLRTALLIGIGLGVFAHATGINLILYYTPEILKSSGIEATKAISDTVFVGLVNFVVTFVAFFCVDKLGRKPLLLAGSAGMGAALFLLGRAFMTDSQGGPWTLLWILVYVAFFAVAMGPVVWVVIAEIFPTHIRGRAVSLAALSSWIACFTISQLFPIMLERLNGSVFFIYGAICIIAFLFVAFLLPETKGKSLEEIEQLWKR